MNAAQQLSQWIEATHPALFAGLHQRVTALRSAQVLGRSRLRGFGDDTPSFDFTSAPDFSDSVVPAGSFDDNTVTVTADVTAPIEIPTVSASDLTSPGMSATSPLTPLDVPNYTPLSPESSGGFLQSIGSGIASAATNVGNFLTSNQGLADLTKLGTAYFQLQNNKTNAQLQTTILQAQIARASQGLSPLPITYARSPTGQMVPVYTTSPLASQGIYPANMPTALQASISAGQSQLITLPDGSTGYTVPPHIVGSLSSNIPLSGLLPWILLFGAGLVLLKRI